MKFRTNIALIFALTSLVWPSALIAETRNIVFPVAGKSTFRNDFREPRDGGVREHLGNDIIAAKMTPLVSTVDGVVSYVVRPEAVWGYAITINDTDGYQYRYLHLNNDSPGTDDGKGGEANAYAPGMKRGTEVKAGQIIGFVGDSGNAENTVSHLHFEIRSPSRVPINPYDSLVASAPAGSIQATGVGVSHKSSGEAGVAEAEFVFVTELKEEMRGTAIRELQSRLKNEGHFTFYLTEYFGPITKTALKKYQRANHIAPTGVLGFETRALLNNELPRSAGKLRLEEELFEGMKGEAVQQVQLKLEALGHYSGPITGIYDDITREAVRRFQVAKGVTPSGHVSFNTWNKLNDAYSLVPIPQIGGALPPAYAFTRALSIGSRGEEVKMLQKELQGLGFFSASVSLTEYFGPITHAAVAEFQAVNDIESIGIVGPKTRAALNAL